MKQYLFSSFLLVGISYLFADNSAMIPPNVENIYLKSPTQSLTPDYFYILKEGVIWKKRRHDLSAQWKVFPPPKNKKNPPVMLSADGENILVVRKDGDIDYGKNKIIKKKDPEHQHWFGSYRSMDFFLINLFFDLVGGRFRCDLKKEDLAFGHRGPHVSYYTDSIGNRHGVTTGVGPLIRLNKKTHDLYYTDPWALRTHYKMMGPDYNTFKTFKHDISGSVLFVIDRFGRMRTRLTDIDIDGHNPGLSYTTRWEVDRQQYKDLYDSPGAKGKSQQEDLPRVLGPRHWQERPMIPLNEGAFLTGAITILSTGLGNEARELRVEGCHYSREKNKDICGFWKAPVTISSSDEWQFISPSDYVRVSKDKLEAPVENEVNSFDSKMTQMSLTQKMEANYKGKFQSGLFSRYSKVQADISVKNLYQDSDPILFKVKTEKSEVRLAFYESNNWNYFIRGPGHGNLEGFLTYQEKNPSESKEELLKRLTEMRSKDSEMDSVLKILFGKELSRRVKIQIDDKKKTAKLTPVFITSPTSGIIDSVITPIVNTASTAIHYIRSPFTISLQKDYSTR